MLEEVPGGEGKIKVLYPCSVCQHRYLPVTPLQWCRETRYMYTNSKCVHSLFVSVSHTHAYTHTL